MGGQGATFRWTPCPQPDSAPQGPPWSLWVPASATLICTIFRPRLSKHILSFVNDCCMFTCMSCLFFPVRRVGSLCELGMLLQCPALSRSVVGDASVLWAVWLRSCLDGWFSHPPSANVTPRSGVGHTVKRFPESSSGGSENAWLLPPWGQACGGSDGRCHLKNSPECSDVPPRGGFSWPFSACVENHLDKRDKCRGRTGL